MQEQFDALKKQVAALTLKPGPVGKPGRNGTNGTNGKDGRGIKSVSIDERGNLVLVFTDKTRTAIGRVVGRDGKPGVVSVEFTENGKSLKRISDIKSGSRVRQPIERVLEEK